MSDEVRVALAAGLALVTVLLATPVAIRVARRIGLLDRPTGYKSHRAPTPYLGGAAVMTALACGLLVTSGGSDEALVLLGGALAMAALGTIDDRYALGPLPRVILEVAVAIAVWSLGFGWSLFDSDALNLAVTVLWIVAIVNAFNLMDNMDGAAASVGAATATGIAVLALVESKPVVAAAAGALAAACIGFLRWNLASPARIFLGDGGSMPLGFVIAMCVMGLGVDEKLGAEALIVALFLVALPALDVTLVIVSRSRRGISLVQGGTDHLTHRLRLRLPSARVVAAVIGGLQLSLAGAAIGLSRLDNEAFPVALVVAGVAGALAIAALETLLAAPAAPLPHRAGTRN